MAVPKPPAAHRIPVPNPKRRRNQPLTDAIKGTMAMDWVSDSKNPKTMKNCHNSRTNPSNTMLTPYKMAPASIIRRAPYRSPSQPLTGAKIAPTR